MQLFRSPPTLLFFSFLLGCAHPQPSSPQNPASGIQHSSVLAQHPTSTISNADIHWHGNIAGLWLTIIGPSKNSHQFRPPNRPCFN